MKGEILMSLWDKIVQGVNRMLGRDTIINVIKVKPAISNEMENAIQLWTDMYLGKAPWLKEGTNDDPETIVSLGLPSLIASEKARMATLEMESEITAPMQDVEVDNPDYQPPGVDPVTGLMSMGHGSMTITESKPVGPTERADYLNHEYQKVKDNLRTQLEYGCAKGGFVIKPYVRAFESAPNISNEATEDNTKEQNPALKDIEKQSSFSANSDVAKKDKDAAENNSDKIKNDKEIQTDGEKLADDKFTSSATKLPQYEIEFDFVQADRFYPLSIDATGRIVEAVFIQQKIERDIVYSRLEYHKFSGRSATIMNYAFKKNNNNQLTGRVEDLSNLGKEVPLTEVEEWANLQPEVTINNVDRPLFAYFKMPEANTVDTHSPLGVSCYSRVTKLIQNADQQYSRLLWEYEGGEMAIDVDRDAMRPATYYNSDGVPVTVTELPRKQQRLFRTVDLNSEETYQVFAPTLRDDSIVHGLNVILMRIEDATGLSRGTISEQVSSEARTATEMKILKQRSYAANADIQKALEKTLRDTVYVMDVYCTLYDITPAGEYEVSFEWDDSILVDSDTELEKRMSLVNGGISSKLETRMWYFGETENQAKQALQRIEDEKKSSIETNIISQQEIGADAQGKDFTGDNNNPGNDNENSVNSEKKGE